MTCWKCSEPTSVFIDRDLPTQTGLGCTTCGTARAVETTCTWEGCSKTSLRHFNTEDASQSLWYRYCDDHAIAPIPVANAPKKPLTDYEREKLAFTRTDKAWRDNIAHRKVVRDPRTGKPSTVITDDRGNIRYRMPSPRDRN